MTSRTKNSLLDRLLRPLFRRVVVENDNYDMKNRKKYFSAYLISTSIMMLYGLLIYHEMLLKRHRYGLGVAILASLLASVFGLIHLISTRTMPDSIIELVVAIHSLTALLADFNNAQVLVERNWPIFIIILDILLVCKVRYRASGAILVGVTLYLMITQIELSIRFGLFDVEGTADYEDRVELTNCKSPPCSVGLSRGSTNFFYYLAIFILDYHFTRGFSARAESERLHLKDSITLSERVTAALVDFDLDLAELIIKDSENASADVLSQLLDNLKLYRPYLPDSLFDREVSALIPHTSSLIVNGDSCLIPIEQGISAPGYNGFAAIVFTDIVSSTVLWEAATGTMKRALKKHNTIIRDYILAFDGYEVKTIGDAFMVAFDELSTAIVFGLLIQERLYEAAWPSELDNITPSKKEPGVWSGIRIRVGINHGPVEREVNPVTGRYDYFGPTVNTAARMEAACVGGCIAVSNEAITELTTQNFAKHELTTNSGSISVTPNYAANACIPADTIVIPVGEKKLKGVTTPINISLLLPGTLSGRATVVKRDLSAPVKKSELPPLEIRNPLLGVNPLAGSSGNLRLMPDHLEKRDYATIATIVIPKSEMTKSLQSIASSILQCSERTNGCIASVCNSSFVVGWNTSKPCREHVSSTIRFTSLLSTKKRSVSCGVASGALRWGNVGNYSQKFVTIVGSCVDVSRALAVYAAGISSFTLITGMSEAPDIDKDPYLRTITRPIDVWKVSTDILVICQVNIERAASPSIWRDSERVSNSYSGPEEEESEWGWSESYRNAFNQGNADVILNSCDSSDVIAMEAAKMIPEFPRSGLTIDVVD